MISTELARLEHYGIEVQKEDVYNLRFPAIRFSAGLFWRVC